MRLLRAALILACFDSSALPSIFVAAICKDGVVVVADSRLTFTDNQTGQPVAYADGLNKIIRFDSAVMAMMPLNDLVANRLMAPPSFSR
jgi:hypothetical protein